MSTAPLDIQLLKKSVHFNSDTGEFVWLKRDASTFDGGKFTAEHACANWNSRYCGKPAFAAPHINGYLMGCFMSKHYLAHRIAFAIYFGYWPLTGLDHVNGIKTDNRICNLREADHAENARNQKTSARNSTGVLGVSYDKARGKYFACIRANGRSISLGRFTSIEEASAARKQADEEHGFHQNHGRAAS